MFRGLLRIEKSYWLLVPIILYSTIPWFNFRIRLTYMFIPMLAWVILNLPKMAAKFSDPRFRSFNGAFFCLLMFNYLNNFYALLGHGSFTSWNEGTFSFQNLCFFLMAHYMVTSGKFRELRFLTILTLVGLCIAGVASARGLSSGLEGARSMVGMGGRELTQERLENLVDIVTLGLGNYRFVYMAAWLIGPFLMAVILIKNRIIRVLLLSATISCILTVRGGGLGTAVGVGGLSIGFFVLWWTVRSRKLVKICGYMVFSLFFFYATLPVVFYPLAGPLRAIAENMEEGSIKMRLNFMALTFEGDKTNYAYDRVKMQLTSLSAFLRHPFFGIGLYNEGSRFTRSVKSSDAMREELGGHSTIMDGLAQGGIFQMGFFFAFWVFLARYYRKLAYHYFGYKWLPMTTMFIALFLFTSLANRTFGVPIVVYYLLPGLALMSLMSRGIYPGPYVKMIERQK